MKIEKRGKKQEKSYGNALRITILKTGQLFSI